MLSQIPSRGERTFVAPCFHILTNCFPPLPAGLLAGKPFGLTTIALPRLSLQCSYKTFRLCVSVSLWQIPSFHTIADSLSSRKKSSALESATSGLFCKNTRGGGYPFTTKLVSRSPSPRSSQSKRGQRAACFAESRAVATFQGQNHYLPEAALC